MPGREVAILDLSPKTFRDLRTSRPPSHPPPPQCPTGGKACGCWLRQERFSSPA